MALALALALVVVGMFGACVEIAKWGVPLVGMRIVANLDELRRIVSMLSACLKVVLLTVHLPLLSFYSIHLQLDYADLMYGSLS